MTQPQSCGVYWFRQDLRLHDQPALTAALAACPQVVPVWVWPDNPTTAWGFARHSGLKLRYLADTALDLRQRLRALGSDLLILAGPPAAALAQLQAQLRAQGWPCQLWCEEIAAPDEEAELQAARAAGWQVHSHWQSGLFALADLPFRPDSLPQVFTPFRQLLARTGCEPAAPVAPISALPALPAWTAQVPQFDLAAWRESHPAAPDPRAALRFDLPEFVAGESAALRYLQAYLASELPTHYKQTRNGLLGAAYSSKWSAWLASGALSVRQIYAGLAAREQARGADEGSEWLYFELLWREYFRHLHRQHGRRLYRASGLNPSAPAPTHDPARFAHWCEGQTGQPFIDAGMRELRLTGYLSNRLRQNVASYFVHDLGGDWRAGAAWFEAQLVDYDVYSNQGNWLYLAGRGTDPRAGRRFNPLKQAHDYDRAGDYQRCWAAG
ncbi:DASH family cryptochrome [Chitinibacter tainanensis]|uniref:DASH family cryptochrome n=1 Tax=Chitinibacter tainanensis TaxID=230667 RepID=UPI0004134512|nr:DASH family cryptochrome [Chitinibacter tainanensis]